MLTTDQSDTFTPVGNGWEELPRSPKSIATALEALAEEPVEMEKLARWNRTEADLQHTRQAYLRTLYTVLGLSGLA